VANLSQHLEDSKRFVLALAESNVPRLKQLVHVVLKQWRSLNFIIDQIARATQGVYHAKGFKNDKGQ
jgi:hypothetical protein